MNVIPLDRQFRGIGKTAIRERVGRELVWLDVHKDPDVFSRETVLSPSNDPVSRLWNHVTGQFRA
jgi:hypothetical protein